jgi:hypothetical protein
MMFTNYINLLSIYTVWIRKSSGVFGSLRSRKAGNFAKRVGLFGWFGH